MYTRSQREDCNVTAPNRTLYTHQIYGYNLTVEKGDERTKLFVPKLLYTLPVNSNGYVLFLINMLDTIVRKGNLLTIQRTVWHPSRTVSTPWQT